jgi:hypothetical protein
MRTTPGRESASLTNACSSPLLYMVKGASPSRSAIGVTVSSGRRLWLPSVTDLPLTIACFFPVPAAKMKSGRSR